MSENQKQPEEESPATESRRIPKAAGVMTGVAERTRNVGIFDTSEDDDDDDLDSMSEGRRGSGRPKPKPKILNRDAEEMENPEEIEELASLVGMYEDSLSHLEEGEILKGRIIRVDEKDVLVDIGFKSEGIIAISEFSELDTIKVGDTIDVFLERLENQDGLVVLSKQRADFVKVWDRVKDAAEKGEVVEGRLVKKIKGGFVVDLFGVEAFLPGSQVALRPSQSVEGLMNETLKFKIIKLNKRRRNIVVSRRLVLEEERAWAKTNILKELEVGQIREGFVKNITDFGAFVDLGGIDGLLHITDMSWGRIRHPSEVLNVGDKIEVKVLSFDPDRERISLGLKQLSEYPWERVEEKYPVGSKLSGRVVSLTDYGAFVELEKGVEGLIHVSEMSWTKHVRHPSKILQENHEVECMVLKVDKENEKISLGLKQVEPDPWLTLDEKYPINSVVEGKVRNLTNFGAFVELEEGIDGLVHISDLSWTRRVGHPSEVVKKSQDVSVRVLAIDKVARRISLGLKQVEDDPWPQLIETFTIGAVAKPVVNKITDKGLVVMLEDKVEGFIPVAHLGIDKIKDPADHFKEGDELDAKVLRVDSVNHRILLSVKAYYEDQEKETLEEFQTKFGKRGQTVGDAIGDAAEAGDESEAEGSSSEGTDEIADLVDEAVETDESAGKAVDEETPEAEAAEDSKDTPPAD
ncbi:MAG: 30S ribosomal protein S1 [Candidatus Eisenbacteria bacterium]|uniref:Small ribosomal subunit protein bS1 n=1 Tax=Eiseniibacteriota bacterium TaxID=2212470 RepID=A0A948WCU0_UNCEI|nr:30S ribosomal protein S1 [Candidatus Eisenbacteria bacterium]MBU1947157.1 30S ribosomal protein S1 [Candidatus Eisenbacteria bacterium]MBU2691223.1 30S ribosomal protein S1 [Candidatus Eisenbacteria bacterium]